MAIDGNGITIKTLDELIAALEVDFKTIYGDNINLETNSPDRQLIEVLAQNIYDLQEQLVAVYNSFDPDKSVGYEQDRTYKLNGILRKEGVYTQVSVLTTVSASVSLTGLDDNYDDPDGTGYTISDSNGNQFILIDSINLTAGSYYLEFRAKEQGNIEILPNTITNFVDVVAGVVSVNNPSAPYTQGEDEETDSDFRLRRNKSVGINSNSMIDSMEATINNINEVEYCRIYENVEATVDSDGIPAHGIWVVVQGGTDADIGQAIYAKHCQGTPMKGATEEDITRPNGLIFTAKFDRPFPENLYISFNIQTTDGSAIDATYLREQIVANLDLGVYDVCDNALITNVIKEIIPASAVDTVKVSLDGLTWANYLYPSAKNYIFAVDTSRIIINGSGSSS